MLTTLLLLVVQAMPSAERIDRPALPDFIVGYSAKNGEQSIVEQVPRGETVEAWTRMVTSQRFVGAKARGVDARTLIGRVAAGWVRSCPGGSVVTPDAGRSGTAVWASIRMNCPRNPATGRPETMFMRAFDGAADGWSVQVAFRRVASPADERWAREYLGRTRLCGAGAGC